MTVQRSRQRPLAPRSRVARLVWLAPLAWIMGCAPAAPPPPTEWPGFPSPSVITVSQASPEADPVLSWTNLGALSLEVRHVPSRRVVWRIEGAETPNGQRLIASPLAYGAPALPPGVNPPDGPDYHTVAGPEPLESGQRYAVGLRLAGSGEASELFTAQ